MGNRQLDGRLKLIVRDYQDQQVLFITDSGYRLPGFHFDSTLNTMLLLSYGALKHGDGVAAASFCGSECWIPLRKGISALICILNGLYDLGINVITSSQYGQRILLLPVSPPLGLPAGESTPILFSSVMPIEFNLAPQLFLV